MVAVVRGGLFLEFNVKPLRYFGYVVKLGLGIGAVGGRVCYISSNPF